jgi:hypothetical protein
VLFYYMLPFSLLELLQLSQLSVLMESIDSFLNKLDTKECVAFESNKTEALNPKMGIVPVTTFVSPFGSPGISE